MADAEVVAAQGRREGEMQNKPYLMLVDLGNIEVSRGKRYRLRLIERFGRRELEIRTLLLLVDGKWETGCWVTFSKESLDKLKDKLDDERVELSLSAVSPEELEREVKGDLPKPSPPPRTRTAGQRVSRNQPELDFDSPAAPPASDKEA
jgi:hypothetical protein